MATAATSAAGLIAGSAAAAEGGGSPAAQITGRQPIELRLYTFASIEKRKAYESFLAATAIPAFNRAGVGLVGAFRMLAADNKLKEDSPNLYVVLAHKSAEAALALPALLVADAEYQKAGQAIIQAPKSAPAFLRCETTLMLAFEGHPQVVATSKADGRVAQLRIYESHSEDRATKKIEMFNQGGEIALFRKTGLQIVFFGQSLAGPKLPNLTYMLCFEDDKAMAKAWAEFLAHPDWDKMKNDPAYKDTVSNITNLALRPIAGSQI